MLRAVLSTKQKSSIPVEHRNTRNRYDKASCVEKLPRGRRKQFAGVGRFRVLRSKAIFCCAAGTFFVLVNGAVGSKSCGRMLRLVRCTPQRSTLPRRAGSSFSLVCEGNGDRPTHCKIASILRDLESLCAGLLRGAREAIRSLNECKGTEKVHSRVTDPFLKRTKFVHETFLSAFERLFSIQKRIRLWLSTISGISHFEREIQKNRDVTNLTALFRSLRPGLMPRILPKLRLLRTFSAKDRPFAKNSPTFRCYVLTDHSD